MPAPEKPENAAAGQSPQPQPERSRNIQIDPKKGKSKRYMLDPHDKELGVSRDEKSKGQEAVLPEVKRNNSGNIPRYTPSEKGYGYDNSTKHGEETNSKNSSQKAKGQKSALPPKYLGRKISILKRRDGNEDPKSKNRGRKRTVVFDNVDQLFSDSREEPSAAADTSSATYYLAQEKGEVEKEKPNLNFNPLSSEEEKEAEAESQDFVREYIKCLDPYRKFCRIFSRFPIEMEENKNDEKYVFSYNPKSFHSWMFLSANIFVGIVSIIISCNFMGLLMNFPSAWKGGVTSTDATTTRAEELFIFKRNLAPFILFCSCLFHVNVGNWNFYLRRKYVATYLNFWPDAIKILRFNAAVGTYNTSLWLIGSYSVFLILILLITLSRIVPATSGFPGLASMLVFRVFNPSYHATDAHTVTRILVSFFILFIIIASKTYPLLFILKCKLMRNCFALWNRRLDIILNKTELYFPKEVSDHITDRVSFPDIFRGHVVLLDLLEGNDEVFSETIESYLGSQITSVVFEFYWFYRAQGAEREFEGSRSMDQIFIGLYLAQSLLFLFLVVFSANDVNVEAMDGLEIIRRRGFIGRKSNDELYFSLSMYMSYTGHFDTGIYAAGYFVYNKTYMVSLFGAIATYLIIFFQFAPTLDLVDSSLRPLILDEARLLQFVEDTVQLFPSAEAINVGTYLMDAFELEDVIATNETLNEIFV